MLVMVVYQAVFLDVLPVLLPTEHGPPFLSHSREGGRELSRQATKS